MAVVRLEPVAMPSAPRTDGTVAPEVRIRQFQPSNQKQVADLFAAGMLYYADFYADALPNVHELWNSYVQESINDDLAKIEQVYIQPGGNFWVATVNDGNKEKVVGMVGLEKKPNGEGELRRMSVSSEFRRFGLGRQLVSHLEAWAKESGYSKVVLSTGAIMFNAVKFYPSIGYELTRTEIVSQDPEFEAHYFAKNL